jgi:hypothetical protein
MKVLKGEQKCELGNWWDMFQRNELVESCRGWEKTCHARNDQVLLLNVALTRVTKLLKLFFSKTSICFGWRITSKEC